MKKILRTFILNWIVGLLLISFVSAELTIKPIATDSNAKTRNITIDGIVPPEQKLEVEGVKSENHNLAVEDVVNSETQHNLRVEEVKSSDYNNLVVENVVNPSETQPSLKIVDEIIIPSNPNLKTEELIKPSEYKLEVVGVIEPTEYEIKIVDFKIIPEIKPSEELKIEAKEEITLKPLTIEKKEDMLFIKTGEISIATTENLIINESKLYIETSSGNKQIKFMPEEESSKFVTINNIELKEEDAKPIYSIKETKQAKIFALFPVRLNIETKVSAETGDTLSITKPWWSFLAQQ